MTTDQAVNPAHDAAEIEDGFRLAMRKLASTVSLVTTVEAGIRYGMPATAVSSLSLEPPSLLVCVNRSASMHGPTTRSRYFCVNLLSHAQAPLLGEFSSRASAERFGVGGWKTGPFGLPFLPDAASYLFCAVEDELHYGTHTVFIGRVTGVQADETAPALIYHAGATGRFVQD
ncbi:MAG: flavin reductase family protein [Janthinobacterium lividum]